MNRSGKTDEAAAGRWSGASQQLLAAMADHLPGLVAYIGSDERYRFVNERFRAAFDRPPESFIGRSMQEMLGDALYDQVKGPVRTVLGGEAVRFETVATRAGTEAHFQVEYIPNRGPGGEVDGFFALVLDITARKTAELLQARNEARLRDILSHAPDAFLATDPQGVITEWNRQAERAFGWRRAEAVGMPLSRLLRPEQQTGARVVNVDAFGSRVQTTAVHKDGQPVPVELSVASVPDGPGYATIAFLHDISARKAAEDALRESQESLAITGRLAGVGGWRLDLPTSRMHWSDVIRDIHEVPAGYAPSLVEALDFVEVDDQPRVVACLEDGVRSGKAWQVEVPIRTARRNRRWVRIVGDTQYDEAGQALRVVGALQDITERKNLELRLAAREEFIRGITDSLPVRIGYVGRDGRYQFVNEAYRAHFGRPREEILGRTRAELMGEQADARIAPHRAAALAGVPRKFETEEVIGGQTRHVENQLLPDLDGQGGVRGVFKTGVDVTERRAAEHALRELADIFANTPDFVVQSDWQGRLVYMNPAVRAAVGFDAGHDIGTHSFAEFYPEATVRRLVDEAVPHARQHGVWIGENEALLPGGRVVPISHMVLAHRDESGRVSRYSSVMRDISEQVQARNLLHRQSQTLGSITEAIPAVVAAVGPDGRYRFVNSAFERWRGLPRDAILGRPVQEVLGAQEYAVSAPHLQRALAGEAASFERDSRYADGAVRTQLVSYIPLRLPGGEVDGFVDVAQDITAHKEEELRLLKLSERDPLTGVLNRHGFETYLERQHVRQDEGLAMLFIDLDRFKPVNDNHGHPVGDALLKGFAERLQRLVRPTDIVARLGGDEFAIVLPGVRSRQTAEDIADKVVAAAAAPFGIDRLELHIGASVGVALWADDGWGGLIRRADAAVYQAKAMGRGRRATSP